MKKPRNRKRLIVLVVTAVLVTVGVCGYIESYLARPIGEGPAGPILNREVFARVWSDETIHVIGIGDSITAGLGAKSPSHTFFNRMLQNPTDEFADMKGVCLAAVLPNPLPPVLAFNLRCYRSSLLVLFEYRGSE